MGKGSKRRPGKGYADKYSDIFSNSKPVTSRKVFGISVRGSGLTTSIINDIEAFKSPIDGRVITSRSSLREHNKQHGVTDSRDYSKAFLHGKYKQRMRESRGDTRAAAADRRDAIIRAANKKG